MVSRSLQALTFGYWIHSITKVHGFIFPEVTGPGDSGRRILWSRPFLCDSLNRIIASNHIIKFTPKSNYNHAITQVTLGHVIPRLLHYGRSHCVRCLSGWVFVACSRLLLCSWLHIRYSCGRCRAGCPHRLQLCLWHLPGSLCCRCFSAYNLGERIWNQAFKGDFLFLS